MRGWLIGALAYLYLAWTFFRLCRRDRDSWWFTSALTVCGPFLIPIGLLMQLGKLRHFSFKGFIERQREALGLSGMIRRAEALDENPDDGGFGG